MLKITRTTDGYYIATWLDGNLCAFTINDLIYQLWQIYGFSLSLFQFNQN